MRHINDLPFHKMPTKALCLLLSFLMFWTPIQRCLADAMQDSALQGQDAANKVAQQFNPPSLSNEGSLNFTVPSKNGPVPVDVPVTKLFQGSDGGDVTKYTGLYDNNAGTISAGLAAQTTLGGEVSRTGEAYRTIVNSANKAKPDLTNDPIWKKTDDVMGNISSIASTFSDCSSNNTFTNTSFSAKLPDYKTCSRTPALPTQCVATHDLQIEPVILPVSGETKISSCGEGCTDIWVGKIGDDYWHSACGIFKADSNYTLVHPEAIISANIVSAQWDDYLRVFLDNQLIWTGTNGWKPQACESYTSSSSSKSIDITKYFQTPGPLNFSVKVMVSGGGEGYSKIRIMYDPKKIITKDKWTFQDSACQNLINAEADKVCKDVKTSCQVDPGKVVKDKSCMEIITAAGPINVCDPYFSKPPFSGISSTCSQATMTATCDLQSKGTCWTDSDGVQHCPSDSVVASANKCSDYEAKGCAFIRSDCVEGATGSTTGKCWLFKDVYDCGSSVNVPTVTSSSSQTCSGPVRCMGEECVNINKTQSKDFVRATAALNAAQQASMDKTCVNKQDAQTCTLFNGTGGSCKTVGLGITSVDCCNSPNNVGLGEYLDMIYGVSKVHNAVMRLDATTPVRAAWQTLSDPITSTADAAYSAVTSFLDTQVDSITGQCTATFSDFAQNGLIDQFTSKAMEMVAQWTADTFGPQAANMVFSAGGQAAFSQSGTMTSGAASGGIQVGGGAAMIGSMLNVFMIAYAVYKIAVMIIQMVYKCQPEEYELAAKKTLKACHYLGTYCASKMLGACIEQKESYCCFSSPLTRIMQEQIRPQLGMSFGDIKNPTCDGIPIGKLNQVNWDNVNLDEWIAILQSTNRLQTEGNASQKLNIDRLTGAGSVLNTDGTRLNALDRNQRRIQPIDANDIRQKVESKEWTFGPMPTPEPTPPPPNN